jgi:5'-3' exoribonuclease 1
MNGIIHGCTHPNHLDVSEVLSEKDMMLGIMHYLDRIITQIVKPKVSVFMAIDGVAPRAKLNQQRSRRFRSAKDMKDAAVEAQKKQRGLVAKANGGSAAVQDRATSTTAGVFDSNCITPGTEFMEKVSRCIQYFIRKKIKEDPLWKNLKVIYSGHDVPGEGEHKIMQHIRDMKNQPGYKPNTRHCMYGQDADLIMLGLVSHEPHFTLLREIVDFGAGFSNNQNALKAVTKFTKQSDFQLLHLSILREYLNIEFSANASFLESQDSNSDKESGFDLERIIDDFIFMTFLVGNDFLPHMPTLDIGDGAFDLLFNTYKEQRKSWEKGQYLTYQGQISDPARLERFLAVIGSAETEIFERKEENEAKYIQKKRKWDKRDGKPQGPSDEEIAAQEASKQDAYELMIQQMIVKHGWNAQFVQGWSPPVNDPAIVQGKDFKGRYYYEKLHLTPINVQEHLELRKAYVEGLLWCLAYYYRGCISWGWFYPYHYGPLISDLTNLPEVFQSIAFEEGEPLKPFEQLMGCLPPASASIVPKPYRKLMCSPDSPIIQFYPEEFEIDMNGKKNPWEGVNLLPFIDVNLLRKSILELCPDHLLTPDERRRNTLGKVYLYSFDDAIKDTVPSFNRDIGILDIPKCNSRVEMIDGRHPTHISFKPELIPGTQIPYPGFPSLTVLPMKCAELMPIGLNCFGTASKYSTTLLIMQTMPQLPGAEQISDSILGKSLYINWPMMHEAKVVAVSDSKCVVKVVKKKKKVEHFTTLQAQRWIEESDLMTEQYKTGTGVPGSGGVDIGAIQIRLKLLPLQGMKTSAKDGSKKKVFGTEEADVPLQMVLWKSPAPDPRFEERGPITLQDRFPAKSTVVLTKGKYLGCVGSVVGVLDEEKVGVKVAVIPPEPPFGLAIARSVQETYVSSSDAAKVLKMHPGVFGKIVGSLFFNPGRYDLGLNLRYKHDHCTLGYARRKDIVEQRGKKASSEKKSAWGSSDTLLVVGNQRSETPKCTTSEESKKSALWEFTPKAIRLVTAYRQAFPNLFAALSKNPNERSYEANILGPDGDKELKRIREWLNNIETAKMPRTPCSTEAMPFNAIAAVQRAADVRNAVLEQKGELKHVNIKVPSSALYREGSTGATDIIQQTDTSPPELGDRIVNLCANGLPFGARGTVVGIHDEKTGCVEVVMDKEFIGGSTLQGMCANFRGKLVVWNHLLKISAANSRDIVDQMIPTGSGKVALQTALNSITDDAVSSETPTPPVMSNTIQNNDKSSDLSIAWSAGLSTNTVKAEKQVTWREAKGPSETDYGFKGADRKVKNGFKSWQKMISTRTKSLKHSKNNHSVPATNETLSAGLKALLGVRSIDENQNAAAPSREATFSGIHSMSDVASSLPAIEKVPVASKQAINNSPSSNAADALLKLMSEGPPGIGLENPVGFPQPLIPAIQQPMFNFTYIKEGDPKEQLPNHKIQTLPHHLQYPVTHMSPALTYHQTMVTATNGSYPQHHPSAIYMEKNATTTTAATSRVVPVTAVHSEPLIHNEVEQTTKNTS